MRAVVLIQADHLDGPEAGRQRRIPEVVFELGHKQGLARFDIQGAFNQAMNAAMRQGLSLMEAGLLAFPDPQPLAFARLAGHLVEALRINRVRLDFICA